RPDRHGSRPPVRATCSPASSGPSSPGVSNPCGQRPWPLTCTAVLQGSDSPKDCWPATFPSSLRRSSRTLVAEAGRRPVWADVDLGAIEWNAGVLRAVAAPAGLCAVVKADAYGHGAVPVAMAALAGGATS